MVVTESAKIVIKQLKQRAAKIWGIDEEAIEWENGGVRPAGIMQENLLHLHWLN